MVPAVLKQTLMWKLIRGVKRTVLPPRADVRLIDEACRGSVRWLNPPPVVEANRPFDARFRLENRAGSPWTHRGPDPVRLVLRWWTHTGQAFDSPPQSVPLPHTLYPGEPIELTAAVTVPDVVGDFVFTADLEQSDGPFADQLPDGEAVSTTVAVVGNRSTDIDYHAVYRTANLTDNHWWVVGAYHSQEQYEKSSRERLEMLVKYGLNPDSWVLDIGCGTGQMASVLTPYLSDQGAYAGTDIGVEAIRFCDANFRRRNFRFAVGGLTTVPFTDDGRFDLAIFFSVFTHTFTDETILLLAEARRLLKPNGSIIADVITSPLVERGAGHRGEMVVNRNHFERLVGMLGYMPTVIGRWPWNRHAERFMFRLQPC